MLSVRLKPETEKRLKELAAQTHRTQTYYIEKALEEFLQDHADYLIALTRLEDFEKKGCKGTTLKALKKELGLND